MKCPYSHPADETEPLLVPFCALSAIDEADAVTDRRVHRRVRREGVLRLDADVEAYGDTRVVVVVALPPERPRGATEAETYVAPDKERRQRLVPEVEEDWHLAGE